MNALLPTLLILLLSGPAAEAGPSGREELRSALREHHAHLMAERLELDEAQVQALRPRLDAVVEAQNLSMAASRRAQRALQQELGAAAPDGARIEQLLDAVLDAETDGVEASAGARRELLDELDPVRRARYLLFEDSYREEVLRRLRGMRQGGGGPPGADSPWRRPSRVEPRPPERREKLVDNLTLLFTLLAGQQLELENEKLVSLVPRIETLVGTQVALAELERRGHAELESALEEGVKPKRLGSTVDRLLDEQDGLRRALVEGRRALAAELEPAQGARLVLLQERFRREAPRRLRMLERLLSAEPDAPGGPGPDRPMQRQRDRRPRTR